MTTPDRPAPGEDIAKGSDGHSTPAPDGERPGDPDYRDPGGHAPESTGFTADGPDAPEPSEPPD